MLTFLWLFLAMLLVLLNGFFVAAEFGMVKLRNTRVQAIQKRYGFRGRILAEVHQNLDAYLSACQLGITLSSLGLGWIGEPAFVYLLAPLFGLLGVQSEELIHVISFVAAFSIISFLHIVVGELVPKSLAIRRSEFISIWTAVPLYLFYWLMYPAIWVLNSCANLLLRITRLDAAHKEQSYSSDEIKFILSASHLHGELTKDETEILEHTLDLADLSIIEVMRPRHDMVALDCNEPIETLLQQMMANRYSRYPIYEGDTHNIIGVIHIKDLFALLYEKKQIKSLKDLMRPVLRVSNRLPAMEVLRKFREGMPHFALVYSDNDTLIGFVTLDNLLHVLIGWIKDEFHHTQDDWTKLPDGSYLVRGDCALYSIERAFDKELFDDEEQADTISGLIYEHLDGLPHEGQMIKLPEFNVMIEKMRGTRILQVKLWDK